MSLKTYRIFENPEEVKELALWLQSHEIAYDLERHAPGLDATYMGAGGLKQEFVLKIHPEDFAEVDIRFDTELPGDFYLRCFSDNDKYEVLENAS